MMHDLPKLALTIRQPWAHAIVMGWKDIENRVWSTGIRGPICIHASKFDKKNFAEDAGGYQETVAYIGERLEVPALAFDDLAFGAIVGVADIVDCVTTSASPWFFGTYGFVLANARPITPIPLKGKQGFFEWRSRIDHPKERPAEPAPESGPVQGLLL